MDSLSYWLVFLSAALVINISPGPDLIYILSRTIAQGRRVGIASSLGVCSGSLVHVAAAALGLSAILATSALAFSIVKYIGAAYLIYLGGKALCNAGANIHLAERRTPCVTPWQAFKQGVLVDILNPKVAIFFMAFLPQFVRPGISNATAQILLLGMIVILMGVAVETLFVLATGLTTEFLRQNRRVSVFLDRALGSIFVALGIRLVVAGQRS